MAATVLFYNGKADQRIGKKDESDEHRRKVLRSFKVPNFVTNQTCAELNGYFGCKSSGKDLKSLSKTDRAL
ncbi:hypothetical protein CKAH01_06164 [Colletotrichum kahawae]|uniref:Uncharacterized protein n=1 Tax=Colletotrichum kahawae TaxID=34407 RepID=A0AAE0D427_COLKA|nr:hypothetical protein CKAH01_06164 [Colletotrichum kahawae]